MIGRDENGRHIISLNFERNALTFAVKAILWGADQAVMCEFEEPTYELMRDRLMDDCLIDYHVSDAAWAKINGSKTVDHSASNKIIAAAIAKDPGFFKKSDDQAPKQAVVFTTSKAKEHEHSHGVAWTCKLYANGKHVANVEQQGWGASDDYDWLDKSALIWDAFCEQAGELNKKEMEADTLAYFTNPRTPNNWPCPDYCSVFIQHLLNEADRTAKIARDSKKHVCALLPGKDHSKGYTIFKNLRPTATVLADLNARYPGIIILNPGV